MASKALPALLLLALVCGELAVDGHAQRTYIGLPKGGPLPSPYAGGGSPAGMQPSPYTDHRHSVSGDDGTGRVPGVEDEKAFMMHSLPAHDRARPVPVPPTAN